MSDTETKLPPHDTDAEEAVIGSLLIDGDQIYNINLVPSDFYYEQNQWLYEACHSLFERGEAINQITIAQELSRRKRLESCGGAAHLNYLVSICPTSLDCQHYAQIVERLSVYRQMISAGDHIATIGYNSGPDVTESLTRAEDMLSKLRRNGYQKPDQVIELWDNAEYEPLSFAVEPLIHLNKPNIWFGLKGACKTQMAMATCMVLFLGWLKNPLKLSVCADSMPTLWLDYENDQDTLLNRLHKLQQGFDMGDDEAHFMINYRRCFRPLSTEVSEIQRRITDTGAQLLVIDSLGIAAGGELKDSMSATRFYSGLRELNITTLILAHTSKDSITKEKSVFGSVYFENLARNIWEIVKLTEEEGPVSTICMYHKNANETRSYEPLGFQFEYQGDRTTVKAHEPTDPSFIHKMPTSVRILAELEEEDLSPTELSERLGEKLNTVTQALKRLKNRGKVTKSDTFLWKKL